MTLNQIIVQERDPSPVMRSLARRNLRIPCAAPLNVDHDMFRPRNPNLVLNVTVSSGLNIYKTIKFKSNQTDKTNSFPNSRKK